MQLINFLFIYPLPSLLTPHPLTPSTTEEITGCTNETAEGANKAEDICRFVFLLISCFTVLVLPSINAFRS